jgi:hypothetical protein
VSDYEQILSDVGQATAALKLAAELSFVCGTDVIHVSQSSDNGVPRHRYDVPYSLYEQEISH